MAFGIDIDVGDICQVFGDICQKGSGGPTRRAKGRGELKQGNPRSKLNWPRRGPSQIARHNYRHHTTSSLDLAATAAIPNPITAGDGQNNCEWEKSFHESILACLMARILLLTNTLGASAEVLPSLGLLQHQVRILPAEASVLIYLPEVDCLFLDARKDLTSAKAINKLLIQTGINCPIIAIATEGALSAMNADWGFNDVILDTAGPAEVEARIRIAVGQLEVERLSSDAGAREIRTGEIVIDENSYTAKIKGRALDLTFKEFELIKFLAQHPGRVFTRAQLLQEIWGYDYFGGTRTVDVHIRRLRSKLGPEYEAVIGTVRNVGYRFTLPNSGKEVPVNAN